MATLAVVCTLWLLLPPAKAGGPSAADEAIDAALSNLTVTPGLAQALKDLARMTNAVVDGTTCPRDVRTDRQSKNPPVWRIGFVGLELTPSAG